MENKINIAELLKDCPEGMELDCTTWENVTFEKVVTDKIYIKRNKKNHLYDNRVVLNQYGCTTNHQDEKCRIFPKGKTTWEEFQRPFKDGDIISNNRFIAIFHKTDRPNNFVSYDVLYYHCFFNIKYGEFKAKIDYGIGFIYEYKYATEEEKQKLLDAIKENGYRWNAETKTLEKLTKFKVGDRVKHISSYVSGIVVKVDDKGYYIDYPKGEGVCFISFTLEKDYELAPNKFDITTLKPFDCRVLVRDYDNRMWIPTFWGKYLEDDSNCRYLTTGGCYRYCIPYNEETKHLLGTTKDCDDFYKTWE